MEKSLIVTVDCGTSNVRSIVFDMSTGKRVSVAGRDWHPVHETGVPGAVDFDGALNWELVAACVRESIADIDVSRIAAVTASGFRHGVFCVDKDGRDVFCCYNMDSRAEEETKKLVSDGIAPRIYELNGDWPNVQGLPRLIWLREHRRDLYDRIDKFFLVADWVVYRLSGIAVTEPGDASSTNVLDLRTRRWSREIIDMCGLRSDIFPDVVDAGTAAGTVTADAARQTGLPRGIPVMTGVADTQAGLTGVGCEENGAAAIVGGSYWLDCLVTDTPCLDPLKRLRTSCHSEPGKWLFEGVGFYVGLSVRWFRDAFGAQEKDIERTYGIDAYSLLERLAAKVPAGSYGLQVLFSDVVNMKYWKHTAPSFIGWDILAPEKSNKGVFFRALLENAALQAFGEYSNITEVSGMQPGKIILSGGAAKSGLWPQILADVLDRPIVVPSEREGTALGAAIYAAVGCGMYRDSRDAAKKLISYEREYAPDAERHESYMKLFGQWRALYAESLELVNRGLVRPMWQAAGTMTDAQLNTQLPF